MPGSKQYDSDMATDSDSSTSQFDPEADSAKNLAAAMQGLGNYIDAAAWAVAAEEEVTLPFHQQSTGVAGGEASDSDLSWLDSNVIFAELKEMHAQEEKRGNQESDDNGDSVTVTCKSKFQYRQNPAVNQEIMKQVDDFLESAKKVEPSYKYLCPIPGKKYRGCHRGFNDLRDLQYHLYAHFELKPFMCLCCDIAYADIKNLRGHYQNKHGNKPSFKCPNAGKGCDSTSARRADINRHFKERCKYR